VTTRISQPYSATVATRSAKSGRIRLSPQPRRSTSSAVGKSSRAIRSNKLAVMVCELNAGSFVLHISQLRLHRRVNSTKSARGKDLRMGLPRSYSSSASARFDARTSSVGLDISGTPMVV